MTQDNAIPTNLSSLSISPEEMRLAVAASRQAAKDQAIADGATEEMWAASMTQEAGVGLEDLEDEDTEPETEAEWEQAEQDTTPKRIPVVINAYKPSFKRKFDPNAFKPFSPADNLLELFESIDKIPAEIALVPLRDKSPIFAKDPKHPGKAPDWTMVVAGEENRELIKHHIVGTPSLSSKGSVYKCYSSGIGMVTGDASGGIFALDVDGISADVWLNALSSGDLPKTVSFKSGKPGRRQLLYKVPEHLKATLGAKLTELNFGIKKVRDIDDLPGKAMGLLESRMGVSEEKLIAEAKEGKFNRHYQCAKDEEGRYTEALEVRYNGRQSCLPPSRHPDTGRYQWINSFEDCAIADMPQWLIRLVSAWAENLEREQIEQKEKAAANKYRKNKFLSSRKTSGNFTECQTLEDALAATYDILGFEGVYNWDGHSWAEERNEWTHGSCPQHASTSGTSFAVNPATGGWICHGCNDAKGHFVGYRSFREGGDPHPKGSDFWKYASQLFNEAGVTIKTQSKGEISKEEYKARNLKPELTGLEIDEQTVYPLLNEDELQEPEFLERQEGEISKEEYQNRKLKPELTATEIDEQAVNLAAYKEVKDAKKEQEFVDYLERLKIKRHRARKYYECDEEKLSKETYAQFPTIEECNKEGQILALKAPKGTGKSTRIKQYIDEARAACWLTVSVTLRRNLGLAQSHDWDIKWVDEDGMEGFFQGQSNTMSCCWDSLHKFIKADYRDKEILLIIDEVESGFDHLSTAATIGNKGKRVEIYQELRRILAHIAKCGGLVIAADADLSDSSVEFLQAIGKTLPVTVIENHYLETKRSVKVFNHQDGQVKLAIRNSIEFGLPFLFASDSIEGVKQMYDYAEKYLTSINCPELLEKIWLINSETGHFHDNKARIVDINKAIREQEPIALFYTPTINVGVSIDGSHFREGFGIFKGTIIADAARQMIARNREVINWVLFADNTANKSKLSEDVLIDPAQIKENIFAETQATQLHTAYVSKKLIEEDLRVTNVNRSLAYTELALKLETDKASFDTAEFHLLANILAKNNYQWKNFHKVFCHGMESEGWIVESVKGSKTGFCEELKELRAKRVKQESEAIASSDHTQIVSQDSKVPTRLEYDSANDILRTSEDRAMRAAAYKVKVAYWCKVDINRVDAELVELIKFNHRWLSGVKFQMYLQNEEIIKTIDGYKINKMAQQFSETGLISQLDLNAKAVQVAAIKEFGLLDIIDLNDDEQTFKMSDFNPLLKKLKNYTNKDLKKWGKDCGISVKSRQLFKNPIGLIVKPMLAKMGYSIVQAKKDAKGDRYYRIPAEEINCLARAMTLEGMLTDWAEQQTQRQLRLTAAVEVNLEQNTPAAVFETVSSEQILA